MSCFKFFCKSYNIYDGLLFFIVMFALNCDACDLDRIQKMFFCVLHTANTLTCFERSFYIKNIGSFENMFSHGFLKHNKKLFSCISGFYNMFVKLQRVLANIPKNIKILFLGGINLLFTVNVWIKKPQRDEYPKYYWE